MKRGRKPGSLVRGTCKLCGKSEMAAGAGQYFRCSTCRADGIRLPSRCSEAWTGKDAAGFQISRLKKDGVIPWPNAFQCADCDKTAEQYDHRDYNKPAVVEPVCRSCNLKRGPAIPIAGSVERLVGMGRVPYVNRGHVAKLLKTMGRPLGVLDGLPCRLTNEHWKLLVDEFTEQPKAAQ